MALAAHIKARCLEFHTAFEHALTLSDKSSDPGVTVSPLSQWYASHEDLIGFHCKYLLKCPKCFPPPKPQAGYYFLTFTRDPKKCTVEEWKKGMARTLKHKSLGKGKYAYEHEDTNIHCHVYAQCEQTPSPAKFESFTKRYGLIHCSKKIHVDNGIEAYIGKENEVFSYDNVTSQVQPNQPWHSPEPNEPSSASSAASAPSSDEE